MIRYYEIMKKRINERRYSHTIGVVETSMKLAKNYGISPFKAELAALLHDYGKYIADEEMLRYAATYDIAVNEVYRETPNLLHGHIGSVLVREELGIEDEDVLAAIRHHTFARADMTTLEKIIYVSDYIEPGRSFDGVEAVREAAEENLDKALLMALEGTIKYLIDNQKLIDPRTIEARNYYIRN